MMLSYDGIVFDLLRVEDWKREAEYSDDKTTFLWWKHEIVVTCILNVDATAASRFPPLPFRTVVPPDKLPIGAPGVVRNTKPIWTPIWESIPSPAVGKPRTDTSASEFDFPDPPEDGPTVPTPPVEPDRRFGGGGDFGPARPGSGGGSINIDGPTDFPNAKGAGGDFSGDPAAIGRAGGKPFIRFGPGRGRTPGRGARLADAVTPAITSNRPTVPMTDVELRARLRRPRRQLLVWLYSGPNGGAEFMLASPLDPAAGSDAQHGPVCTIMDCPEVHGEVSAVMRLGFVTWEAPPLEWTTPEPDTVDSLNSAQSVLDRLLGKVANPESVQGKATKAAYFAYLAAVQRGDTPIDAVAQALDAIRKAGVRGAAAAALANQVALDVVAGQAVAAAGGKDGRPGGRRVIATPALLSNRWTMAFGWNPDTHLRTQSISGEAIFRMDVLRMRGLSADQLRRQIWHPIPEGFQRRPVGEDDVVQSPGGESIQYKVVDDEVLMNSPGGAKHGVIHLEASQGMTYAGYSMVSKGDE